MTYKEVAELFKHAYADQTGQESVDFPWSDQAIINYLLILKNTWFTDLIKSGNDIDPLSYLSICMELEEVDSRDCPCAPPSGCIWVRTKNKVPRFVDKARVSTIDGEEYNFVEWDKVKTKTNSRIKSISTSGKYYTSKNGHIYLPLDIFKKTINITGVSEDNYLTLISSCNITPEQLCNPLDTEFGTSSEDLDMILQKAWRLIPSVRGMAAIDLMNNDTANQ